MEFRDVLSNTIWDLNYKDLTIVQQQKVCSIILKTRQWKNKNHS